MTGRFIILVERDEKTVFPIVDSAEGREDCIAIYPSHEAADKAAESTMACMAWSYSVIDLDEFL